MSDSVPAQPELGLLARSLVDNPAVAAAILASKDELKRLWSETKPEEGERREALYGELRALDALVAKLHGFHAALRQDEQKARRMKIA